MKLGARDMRAETRIQLAMALLGVPAVFVLWKPDAKWPNPFSPFLQKPKPSDSA